MPATAAEMPPWVAPEGTKRNDLELGMRVRFAAVLMKDYGGSQNGGRHTIVGWRRSQRKPKEGVIVGLRHPYSGRFVMGNHVYAFHTEDFEPNHRKRDRTHRAYLVATELRKKAVLVPADDIEII